MMRLILIVIVLRATIFRVCSVHICVGDGKTVICVNFFTEEEKTDKKSLLTKGVYNLDQSKSMFHL